MTGLSAARSRLHGEAVEWLRSTVGITCIPAEQLYCGLAIITRNSLCDVTSETSKDSAGGLVTRTAMVSAWRVLCQG